MPLKYSLPKRSSLIKLAAFVAATLVVLLLLPNDDRQRFTYEENRPWTHALLTAPFDIPVYRDSTSVRQMRDSLEDSFIPVYRRINGAGDAVGDKILAAPGLQPDDRSRLRAIIDRLYTRGIIDNHTSAMIADGKLPSVRMIKDNVAKLVPTEGMRSQRDAYALIDSTFAGSESRGAIQSINLSHLLVPNVVLDTIETDRLHADLLHQASTAIGVIQQGERIVDRGDIVTPQLYQILLTYESLVDNRDGGAYGERFYIGIGQLLFTIIIFGALYLYFFLYRREMWADPRRIVCIVSVVVSFYIFAVVMSRTFASGLYIVPLTIVPILVVVFYDARTALFTHVCTVLLCSPLSSFPFEFIFIEVIAGMTAIFSLRELSNRSELLRTAGLVLAAYIVGYLSVETMISGTLTVFSWRLIGYFAINAVLISFAYVLIFVVEKIFGFISVVTLVELADINNPLLRTLSEECPGTFNHSMAVSNLASEAARRIDANVQLVRAGALYHDIGKISNPAFFTENQHGVNPHDALDAKQSARIIISHIADGMQRADKFKLPAVIRDLIVQHHGKGKAKYFYNTYCRDHPDEDVDEALFTYPGPNPQTREASLLMMADTVEAASRSLREYTPEAISELVNRLIDAQIADGLHSESPLSFRDIKRIKETFASRLATMYHTRISYPADPAKKSK